MQNTVLLSTQQISVGNGTKEKESKLMDLAFAVVLQSVRDYYNKEMKAEVEKWFLDKNNLWLAFLDVDGEGFMRLLRKTPKDDVIAQIRNLSM